MAKAPKCVVIDFETAAIENRPNYPPEPVGVAIKWPNRESRYYAWGHPVANNCTPHEGFMALVEVWDAEGLPILCHNAKFDIAVACEKLRLPMPEWFHIHDTMFLAFLCDPHAHSLGLKELAASWLNWAPDERDEVVEWIIAHKAELPKLPDKHGDLKAPTRKTAGAWISYVPGDIVGRYAIGDIDRTAALFETLYPLVQRNGMGAAYDRERQLMPILMENERIGMRVDLDNLWRDVNEYGDCMHTVEAWLRKELRASGLNFDADRDVASVLLERGIVPEENWSLTASGQLSVKKDVLLPEHFTGPNGPSVASALGYRNRLKTCMEMFMSPWLAQAQQRNGYISTNWNQVRSPGGGTRTGRPSTSNPNFLNISKTWDDKNDGYKHPAFLGVTPLPLVRRYILPDEGHVFLHRDFDGQELRVFAHFEEGALKRAYVENPELDPHAFVGERFKEAAGQDFTRTQVKVMNFQSIYGGGVSALSNKLRVSNAEAKQVKAFHDKALPGRKILNDEIVRLARGGEPIRTWGGRLYYVEEPRIVNGRRQTYEYKLINYEVQGSASELTKQAIIDWYNHTDRAARFLVTVYDEINISAPIEVADAQMALLREVMNAPRIDVPMLSSGKRGPNWGDLEKCE